MTYMCRHPECKRTFDSKVGRAVHEHVAHGAHYTERNTDFMCPYCENRVYFYTELGLKIHLEECHGIPSKSLDWIESRTFENLVFIYSDELHRIQSDSIVGGVLSGREKTRLLREGILVIEEYGRMSKPTIYRLSEEALATLRKLEGYNEY